MPKPKQPEPKHDARIRVIPFTYDKGRATVYRDDKMIGLIRVENGRWYPSPLDPKCRLFATPATHHYPTITSALKSLLRPGTNEGGTPIEHPTLSTTGQNAPAVRFEDALAAALGSAQGELGVSL